MANQSWSLSLSLSLPNREINLLLEHLAVRRRGEGAIRSRVARVVGVVEVESREKERERERGEGERSKGNEDFPEHSTHFSLYSRPTTQTSRLSTPLVETKSDTRKAKLLQMHKLPLSSSYSTPPRSRASYLAFLPLSLHPLLSFFPWRVLQGLLLLFHPPTSTLSIAKTSFRNLLFPFFLLPPHQCFNSPLPSTTYTLHATLSVSSPPFCGSFYEEGREFFFFFFFPSSPRPDPQRRIGGTDERSSDFRLFNSLN